MKVLDVIMPLAGVLWASITAASPLGSRQEDSPATFTNPVLWKDTPDLDVFRVGDVFYYTSSTFAYSPGAPLYKSYDLVNWTPVTHSVPVLEFGDAKYDLPSPEARAYVKGIYASSARYRASTDTWYWMGCVEGTTYIYTAEGTGAGDNGGDVPADVEWNWQQAAVLQGKCYYDNGLLIDDDDTMYVTWGNTNLWVARLTPDGLAEAEAQEVFRGGDTYIEGAHMYKTHGYYWIVPTKVASGEWVLRSENPFGPYEDRVLFDGLAGPLANAGYAHQGGMVDTADGDWYYIAFLDAYPGGRIPVMAPLRWTEDDWPELVTDAQGAWGVEYPRPGIATNPDKTVPPPTGEDRFEGPALGEEWEWNHNPDASKFGFAADGSGGGLVLSTATVTDDLFSARNTLTQRAIGAVSQATFELDVRGMAEGDRAGAALFRDTTAYIGVHAEGGGARHLVFVDGLRLDPDNNWQTASKGAVAATGPDVTGAAVVHLRIVADITPAFGLAPVRRASFSYSLDGGASWEPLGEFTLENTWNYFTGYRYAAFNYATQALGGEVTLKSFEMVEV